MTTSLLASGAPPAPFIVLFLFLCALAVVILLALSFAAMRHVYLIIKRPAQYNGRLGSFVVYSVVAWCAWSADLLCAAANAYSSPGIFATWAATAATLFLLLAGACFHLARMPRVRAIVIAVAASFVITSVLHFAGWAWTVGHRATDAFAVAVAFFLLGSAIYQILGRRALFYAPFFVYFLLEAFYAATWLVPELRDLQGALLVVALPGRFVVIWIWNRAINRAVEEPVVDSETARYENLPRVRVMISSTTLDLSLEREAAAAAIGLFGFEVLSAETLGGVAASPREVCIEMARNCDIFLLFIGRRYGFVPADDGISVTEMEFRTASQVDPNKILVYVARGVDREPRLQSFLDELEQFDAGYFRAFFSDPQDLARLVTKDIARWLASRRPLPRSSTASSGL